MMADPLTCKDFIAFLDAYCDETLEPGRRAEFDRHLGECAHCRAYLDEYRATVRLARSLGKPTDTALNPKEAPRNVIDAVRRALGKD